MPGGAGAPRPETDQLAGKMPQETARDLKAAPWTGDDCGATADRGAQVGVEVILRVNAVVAEGSREGEFQDASGLDRYRIVEEWQVDRRAAHRPASTRG